MIGCANLHGQLKSPVVIGVVGPRLFMLASKQLTSCCIMSSLSRYSDSAVQTVNHRRSSVSGRSSTVLEQSARQRHVSHFVVGFPAATETHTVPAVIPRHYRVT